MFIILSHGIFCVSVVHSEMQSAQSGQTPVRQSGDSILASLFKESHPQLYIVWVKTQ